jgi:hypothetical protein
MNAQSLAAGNSKSKASSQIANPAAAAILVADAMPPVESSPSPAETKRVVLKTPSQS